MAHYTDCADVIPTAQCPLVIAPYADCQNTLNRNIVQNPRERVRDAACGIARTDLFKHSTGQDDKMKKSLRRGFTFITLMAGVLFFSVVSANAQTRQEHVHNMSHGVMPFDMTKTVHIFKMTESGGVQRVIVKDAADTDQIALIQHHLHMESGMFQQGDYSDPASLHGADMPGLKELQIGASGIKVIYAPLPNGAEITFETHDVHLLTALHRWFGAQLSEHGADARAE